VAQNAAAAQAPEAPAVPDLPGAWTPARLRFVSALWGEGFTGPGGAEEALRLSKPLGLQPTHSLLNIGAGLGGAARTITGAFGAWVTAYEQNAELAKAGEALSKRAKLEKKAEIIPLDPSSPRFRPNYYHHALVQEALWTIEDKDAMVAALASAVKPGGQVVITDLTTGPTPILPDDETARVWMKFDRSPAHLITADEETQLFARHGLDIRVAEEISARHVQQAVASWHGIMEVIASESPTPAQALAVIQETRLWRHRLALIRSGRLKLLRWYAIRR
jgi:cyclopropane fatty-acyl-phospholipid synthase-like methyltransferase